MPRSFSLARPARPLATLAALCLLLPAVAAAGDVRGTVTDADGAALAGARIVVEAAGASRTVLADEAGRFELADLPDGPAVLTATAPGHRPATHTVEVGSDEPVDLRLAVRSFEDAITVSAEPGDFDLESDEIELVQAEDMADLLSHESVVAVGGGHPVAQKVYVRGFEDVLLNVTVDGAQQAGELYHHQGRVQIEPEFLKSIELDAGAGPATAGAGALTGALRLVTKDAFDLLEPGRNFGFRLRGTAGWNGDDSTSGSVSVYGRLTDGLGLVVTGLRRDAGHYEDGAGRLVEPTAALQERGAAKLSGISGDHRWSLSYEDLHDEGTYFERPNLVNFTGTYILSDHEMNRQTATYNHRYDPEGSGLDLRGTLYWTSADYRNHRNTTGALYGRGEFSSVGFDLRNTSLVGDHSLTYGVEGRRDTSDSRQQATPPPFWGASEQSASVTGVYLQDLWALHEKLVVSAGLRFDSYEHETDSGVGAGVSNESTGWSPNLSLEWSPVPDLQLRAAYARAFRGITIREAFFSAIYVHRGDLDPERADNLELGFAWERDGVFARGTVFRQDFDDFINAVFDGVTAWGYWENVGDARAEGWELEAGRTWADGGFALGVWDVENTIEDRPLTDADLGLGTSIGRTWTARVDWRIPRHRVDLGLRARLVEDEPNAIAPTAPDKDGYFTADLHSRWRPFADHGLEISATVRNLTDELYWDHATYGFSTRSNDQIGFPSAGRELVLSLAWGL